MAKNKSQGLTSKPPALTRVSPGIYRDAQGNTVQSANGGRSQGRSSSKTREPRGYTSPFLGRQEENAINQQFQGDIGLGNIAQGQMQGIENSYSQPFDWSSLPTSPVSGDFNNWRQQQIDTTNQDFENRNSKAFAQQNDDFEQQMANRGIPMGSKLYNDQKAELARTQNDARQSALNSAMQQAGTNATQFFNVGTQAQNNALNLGMTQRNQPLSEYSALMGAQSGMPGQAYQFGNNAWLQQNAPRGGGSAPPWAQAGFGSYQDYAGFEDARAREAAQFQQGLQPKQPSQGSQLFNTVVPSILGGWAQTW